jgi:hypothetical protein
MVRKPVKGKVMSTVSQEQTPTKIEADREDVFLRGHKNHWTFAVSLDGSGIGLNRIAVCIGCDTVVDITDYDAW